MLLLNFKSSLYILDMNPLSNILFANIFSHSVAYLFALWMVSFDAQNFQIFMKSNLSIFSFVAYAFGVKSKKSLPNPVS